MDFSPEPGPVLIARRLPLLVVDLIIVRLVYWYALYRIYLDVAICFVLIYELDTYPTSAGDYKKGGLPKGAQGGALHILSEGAPEVDKVWPMERMAQASSGPCLRYIFLSGRVDLGFLTNGSSSLGHAAWNDARE